MYIVRAGIQPFYKHAGIIIGNTNRDSRVAAA